MGYTHFWRRPEKLDPETFVAWGTDVIAIMNASEMPLAGWDGTGKPETSPERVSFNGVGEDAHETFEVTLVEHAESWQSRDLGPVFRFCKTAYKPYDVVVTASLVALKDRFPTIEVSSDGDRQDWEAGMMLFVRACRRPAVYPIGGAPDEEVADAMPAV
jgi:hypothetical protein